MLTPLGFFLACIPLICFAAWARLWRNRFPEWRNRFLVTTSWWTVSLVALTESLSAMHWLNRSGLAVGWLGIALMVFALSFRRLAFTLGPKRHFKENDAHGWTLLDRFLAAATGATCFCVGVTALVSAPNGSDALQYHLPRVVMWAERASVAFFPTHYYVQLFAPPLAEWSMLHGYILSGGDRFVNGGTWAAFVGCAIAVSLIAGELGASRRGQLLAAFLCVTLPQGILAASGPKNDWVLAFWLTAMVWFLLRLRADRSWLNAANLGIAVGAAILSKGTAYSFIPFIYLAGAVPLLWLNWRAALRPCAIAFCVVLLLNGPQWVRNYGLAGSPLGLATPDVAGHDKYTMDHISVRGTAANVMRELAMHFGTPSTAVNQRETHLLRAAITRIGVDPDDPGATNYMALTIPHYSREEYLCGNPLHLLLFGAVLAALLWGYRQGDRRALWLALGIAASFVLYCALFRWEQMCPRLHLPLFVVACGVMAVWLERKSAKGLGTMCVILFVCALPPLLCNDLRPLLFSGNFRHPTPEGRSIFLRSRADLYFTEQRDLAATYIPAAAALAHQSCGDIGMDTSIKPYAHEYPLFALADESPGGPRFRYVDVENLSKKYVAAEDLRTPCIVICPDCQNEANKEMRYSSTYSTRTVFGGLEVFSQGPLNATDARPFEGRPQS